jgi:hypothetical protein
MTDMGWKVLQNDWINFWSQTSLLIDVGRYRTWVDLPYVSDHAPVVAQFDFHQLLVAYPFKLNPSWMTEVDFTTIVKEVWWDIGFLLEQDVQIRFVWKLKVLKARIKSGLDLDGVQI